METITLNETVFEETEGKFTNEQVK